VLQGTLWLSAIVGSIAYNWSRPGMKTSVKLIHARFVAPPFFLLLVEYRCREHLDLWSVFVHFRDLFHI
jgi:hypothetical protein